MDKIIRRILNTYIEEAEINKTIARETATNKLLALMCEIQQEALMGRLNQPILTIKNHD